MNNSKKFSLGLVALLLVAVIFALAVLAIPQPEAKSDQAKISAADSSEPNTSLAETADGSSSSDPAIADASSSSTPGIAQSPSTTASAGAVLPSSGTTSAPGSNVRSTVLPTPTVSAGSSTAPGTKSSAGSINGGVADSGTSISIYRTPAEILAGKDLSDPVQRAIAASEIADAEEARYEAVLAKAEQMGIPVRIDGPSHNVQILYDIREEGPLYRKTLNTNAAISTGANLLNKTPYGLNGEGMTVGVWDAARARTNHVELIGKVTVGDSTAANDDHSTHVAGTIAAKGVDPKAKGMGTNTLIRTYDWNSDYSEMTAAGAATAADGATKLPISNHSYGYNATNVDLGRYETQCNTTDALANNLPYYLIFWAAGNEQQEYGLPYGGYQSITFNGLAKNVLTVGAANDAVTSGVRDVAKGTLANFSSMGPCNDGRIKPDIVANGVNVYSSVATGTNTYDGTYSGTSMATPNAAGSAALLQQLYKTNFSGQLMRASMLKALLIHTADNVGRPGPDYQYGWGYLNAKAAADVILAHKASLAAPKMIEDSITSAIKVRTNTFVWDGTSPIRATVVWTDRAGVAQTATNSRTRNLVNDLDLKITAPDGTTSYLPYVMPFVGTWTTASMTNNAVTGTNKVDNVERVDIPAPNQTGTYTVTVGMYGTNALTGTNQVYSLIVTGGAEANPPPVVSITAPTNGATVLQGSPIPIIVTATDLAVGGQPGQVNKVEFFDGATLLGEDTSSPYEFNWTPASSGARSITAKATDNQGATTVSSPVNVTVLGGDGRPTITSFSPASGVAGDAVVLTGTNLGGATGVQFGALPAVFAINSPSQLTATVPAAAVTAPITVTNSYGSATTGTNFTILPILFREDFASLTAGDNTSPSGSGTAWVGNTNFPTGVDDYEAGGAVRIGTKSTAGSITSRAINLSGNGGAFTLSFKVKGWSKVEGDIKVTAGAQSRTVTYVATMSGSFESKSLNFTGGTSATTIKIETTAGRAYIDDVVVAAETPSSPPVITSPSSAGGIAGQAFSYQITASNSPTSFGATNLPAGLNVNTTNGFISGTPAAAGTTVATVSAANGAGASSNSLTINILPSGGGGGAVVTNGVLAGWDVGGQSNYGVSPLAATTYATNFIIVGGLTRSAGVATNSGTPATGAWGGVNWTNTNAFASVTLSVPSGYRFSITSLSTFDYRRSQTGPSSGSLQYSTNGSTFTTITNLSYSSTDKAGASIGPIPLDGFVPLKNIPSGTTLTLRVVNTNGSSGGTWYIFDALGTSRNDFAISGLIESTNAAPSPSISVTGSLSAVNTVYGTASTNPTSFAVSGSNLVEGITVTPPAGFEVSAITPSGFLGQGTPIVVGASGTVSNTMVYVRLADDADVATYSGDIVCSSVGASNVTIATTASAVSPRPVSVVADFLRKTYGNEDPELTYSSSDTGAPLSGGLTRHAGENVGVYAITRGDLTAGPNYAISFTGNNLEITRKNLSITADDITKPFGQTLTLGAGRTNGYSASGLVNGETVGSVTITADGGTGASDPAGTYTLTPSAATGGTFIPSNYSIIYNTGTLTVTGSGTPTFGDWATQKGLSGPNAGANADPDNDGLVNLLEYYMGLEPLTADKNAVSVGWTSGNPSSVSMTYRRAKGTTGVTGGVSCIGALNSGTWSTNGVTENVVDKTNYDSVTATVTNAPSDTQKFLRLKVQQQ